MTRPLPIRIALDPWRHRLWPRHILSPEPEPAVTVYYEDGSTVRFGSSDHTFSTGSLLERVLFRKPSDVKP